MKRSLKLKSSVEDNLRLKVLEKSWGVLDKALSDPRVPKKLKIEISLKLASRNVPTELTGGFTANVVSMGSITRGGEELHFNVGDGRSIVQDAINSVLPTVTAENGLKEAESDPQSDDDGPLDS